MIKLAVSKGRITTDAIELIKDLGFDPIEVTKSRKLIIENETKTISLVLLKAGDIPVYVASGAIDIGIVGKDTVIEMNEDVYEIMQLGFSKCDLCLCGPKERVKLEDGIKVATKYPKLAEKYLKDQNITSEIITLSGSIELAPLINLSDVIIDLVQTGKTLEENNLEVYEVIMKIAPMLIINKISYKTKNDEIKKFIEICERYGGC